METTKIRKTNSSVMIWVAPGNSDDNELSDPLISDTAGLALKWVFFTILCQAVDLFGIGMNVINIVCFIKQGFKEPVNVINIACFVKQGFKDPVNVSLLGKIRISTETRCMWLALYNTITSDAKFLR